MACDYSGCDIIRWNHRDPVEGVCLLIVVIIRVVEQLVCVVLGIDLGLWIKVLEHGSFSISVFQLWIVVERNGGEWVEVVWINSLSFWHSLLVSNSLGLGGTSRPLGVGEIDSSEESWVQSHVGSIVHSSESGECI